MATGSLQGTGSYSSKVLSHWDQFVKHAQPDAPIPVTDAHSLSIAYVVAVAKNGAHVQLDKRVIERLDQTHQALQNSLNNNEIIYGVNTGFGGSANTRTTKYKELQRMLLREFNSGVIVSADSQDRHAIQLPNSDPKFAHVGGLPTQDLATVTSMPTAWVRAAAMIRVNSLARGASGVRSKIVEQIVRLLEHDIVPQVPLHGSISASGDLAPLSYLGSAIQGKANIRCTVNAIKGPVQSMSARDAMKAKGIRPEKIVAKEALAIMNGTAFSCGVGALVIHETHQLVVMSELLTAMSVEALRGSDESFDAFFGEVRPHPGQINSAHCIKSLLRGSKLINTNNAEAGILKQDRYSVRTVSQWLSPVLEDLSLAHDQITTECNSVTDNPLVDLPANGEVRYLHGGNFQARAVTSAMEKARQSLQSVGRMLFAQATEIIGPTTNNGLSPNLVFDEPSESFLFKSIDIMIAALTSELGFLANNAGSHVQTAEMGNQALNSLALISGRYTLAAVDLVAKLEAAHLMVVCQAFDLRAMYERFFAAMEQCMVQLAFDWQRSLVCGSAAYDLEALKSATIDLAVQLVIGVNHHFNKTAEMDSTLRFEYISKALQPLLIAQEPPNLPVQSPPAPLYYSPNQHQKPPTPPSGGFPPPDFQAAATAASETPTELKSFQPLFVRPPSNGFASPFDTFKALNLWADTVSKTLKQTWDETREEYLKNPDATPHLSTASATMYRFVRNELQVPLLHSGVIAGNDDDDDEDLLDEAPYVPTVGKYMTRVYEAMRSGELSVPVMECLRTALATAEKQTDGTGSKTSMEPSSTGRFETLVQKPQDLQLRSDLAGDKPSDGVTDDVHLNVTEDVIFDTSSSSKRSSGGNWLELVAATNNDSIKSPAEAAPVTDAASVLDTSSISVKAATTDVATETSNSDRIASAVPDEPPTTEGSKESQPEAKQRFRNHIARLVDQVISGVDSN